MVIFPFSYDYSFLNDFPEKMANTESSESGPEIDPEDPMRDYLIKKWKKERVRLKKKSKRENQGRNS